MGGESLGPIKAQCPSVGKCQVGKMKGSGWWVVEHPHRSGGWGDSRILEGKPKQEITFEM